MAEKQHVSIVVCGHVDAGKSTTTGRLIFELGGIEQREMTKLRDEADKMGKSSFAFAFYMDRQKEERERGVTISCTTKEFFTESKHYTVVDAPGHRDFIKNMLTGASQCDVALLMVPADGNFTTAIAKGDHSTGEVQGQTRQHSVLINLLGVKQLIVGVNKMDCDTAGYKQERFDEIKNEMALMLQKVGWKKEIAEIFKFYPMIPISGWIGDNLITKSDKMAWWTGVKVTKLSGGECHVNTLLEALDKVVEVPPRALDKPMRMPVSGVYNIKGVGTVITGRVEQGQVTPKTDVVFIPTHTESNSCAGQIFTVEMHHKSVPAALAGDNVGLNLKGLNKDNMPRTGDVMIKSGDNSIAAAKSFLSQVQVISHPGELKVGYSPVGFVRTARSALTMREIKWKIGKETGGKKADNPPFLKANEAAEVVFVPQQPFVVDTFKNCEGLGRIAIMEGGSVVMLGKIVEVNVPIKDLKEEKKAAGAGGDKKPAGGDKKPAAGGDKKAAAPAAAKGGAKKQ
jgi:elongation factor 1-alpha